MYQLRSLRPLFVVIALLTLVGLACVTFNSSTAVATETATATITPTATTGVFVESYDSNFTVGTDGFWHWKIKTFTGEYIDKGPSAFGAKPMEVNLPPGQVAVHKFNMETGGVLHIYAFPSPGTQIYVYCYDRKTGYNTSVGIPPGRGVDLVQITEGEWEAVIFANGFDAVHYSLAVDSHPTIPVPTPATPTPSVGSGDGS